MGNIHSFKADGFSYEVEPSFISASWVQGFGRPLVLGFVVADNTGHSIIILSVVNSQ